MRLSCRESICCTECSHALLSTANSIRLSSGLSSQSISIEPCSYGGPDELIHSTVWRMRRLVGIRRIWPSHRCRRCRIARTRSKEGDTASSRYDRRVMTCRCLEFQPFNDLIVFGCKVHASETCVRDEHTDCLLYTSPSPRDRSLSRMPSSA